jgi:hypothetical protein
MTSEPKQVRYGFTVGIDTEGKTFLDIIGDIGVVELLGLLKIAEYEITEPMNLARTMPLLEGMKTLVTLMKQQVQQVKKEQ